MPTDISCGVALPETKVKNTAAVTLSLHLKNIEIVTGTCRRLVTG